MASINKDEELKLEQQIQESQKQLEELLKEKAQIEEVTQEIEDNLEEMSRHPIYHKYAYLCIHEIDSVMFDAPNMKEKEVKDTNDAQLDIDDLQNLYPDREEQLQINQK